MTRALFTTCGRNIFPAPKRSPTTFIPSMSGPSITCSGFAKDWRASSTSSSMNSVIPFISACSSRFATDALRHSNTLASSFTVPSTVWENSNKRSVASSLRSSNTSSICSMSSLSTSAYTSNMVGFTMPMSIPCWIAWYKNDACIASRTVLFPLKEKLTFETPPLTFA